MLVGYLHYQTNVRMVKILLKLIKYLERTITHKKKIYNFIKKLKNLKPKMSTEMEQEECNPSLTYSEGLSERIAAILSKDSECREKYH